MDTRSREADLFLADLLGVPASSLRRRRARARPVEASDGRGGADRGAPRGPGRWQVVLRPGARADAVRADDLVVKRAPLTGGWWLCRAGDLDPQVVSRRGSIQLRPDVVILRAADDEPIVLPGEDQPPPSAPPRPPAAPDACTGDEAVTDTLALIVARRAPLPVTPQESVRIAGTLGALDDYRSVAAVVPSPAERRLLVFFHGNRDYVTVAKAGDVPAAVDPSRHSRIPRWVDDVGRTAAAKKKAAPLQYGFDALPAAQRALTLPTSASGLAVKNPVVLVPADAERAAADWCVPPVGQYGTPDNGKPTGPGTMRFFELVSECYEHLRCLATPAGRTYLPRTMAEPASWLSNLQRCYVAAHSGGGKPLVEVAGSDMLLVSASSLAGRGGRAVDLWLLDATYGFGQHNYVNFCTSWAKAGLLSNTPAGARFVCVYKAKSTLSNTETEAIALRLELERLLKVPPGQLLKEHDSTDMAAKVMVDTIVPALSTSPVLFIRTQVLHEDIPARFIPLLLRTAAS